MIEDYRSVFSQAFDKSALKRGYFWIIFAAGIVLIALGKIDATGIPKDWKSFFNTVGTTLLTSGVFASLLKTIQYLGIVKDALRDIVCCNPS